MVCQYDGNDVGVFTPGIFVALSTNMLQLFISRQLFSDQGWPAYVPLIGWPAYVPPNCSMRRTRRHLLMTGFSSVQSRLTLCNPMDSSMPGFPVHHQFPELAQTHAHWVGGAIQPSHPLLSPSPPALNPSQHQGLFQWVRWPKCWSFSFIISPSNEYSGLISFRIDWLDLLAVQETLKSLLQHHSSKASVLWCSAFFYI